jgi:hypothetical protein
VPPAKLHNSAALLLLLLLAGGGGDGGALEAGDEDPSGAAGCSKRCAASLRQCVVPLSLKIYIKSNQSTVKLLMTMSQCCGSGMFILIFTHPGSRIQRQVEFREG